jgi:hypothetical protein
MKSAVTHEVAQVEPRDVPALYDRLARVYDVWAALAESKARRVPWNAPMSPATMTSSRWRWGDCCIGASSSWAVRVAG